MNRLTKIERIIVAIASLSLIAVYFVPIWQITLFAPQYPEGLIMKIWLNNITGDIDVINGLNHYIGMRKISVAMFPEFEFLGYIVGFYILLGLVIAAIGNRKVLFWYIIFTLFGGFFAMYDYYRWGYEYGHNLDDTAPIKVPGLSYQPPMIGHKRLLNFDAYSYPDIGGWIIIIAASIIILVWFLDWYRARKRNIKLSSALVTSFMLFFLASCSAEPEPLRIGKDICHVCKMGIADERFGGEVITKKGKIFKFDDIGCMINFIKSGGIEQKDIRQTLAVNYEKKDDFITTDKAIFMSGEAVKSPMGFNIAAFSNVEAASKVVQGETLSWAELYQRIE
ncbi:MAG TPA: nitrous oxide reductase accessory protein NosL [Chitinophagaceae bacterium]